MIGVRELSVISSSRHLVISLYLFYAGRYSDSRNDLMTCQAGYRTLSTATNTFLYSRGYGGLYIRRKVLEACCSLRYISVTPTSELNLEILYFIVASAQSRNTLVYSLARGKGESATGKNDVMLGIELRTGYSQHLRLLLIIMIYSLVALCHDHFCLKTTYSLHARPGKSLTLHHFTIRIPASKLEHIQVRLRLQTDIGTSTISYLVRLSSILKAYDLASFIFFSLRLFS